MIFPIIDLVPDICGDLSARDIRALACTSRDVHEMLVPFMEARAEEAVEHLRTMSATYHILTWPRLHRTINNEVSITSTLFEMRPHQLDMHYTGALMITRSTYLFCYNSYVRVHNGRARYAASAFRYSKSRFPILNGYVFATDDYIPLVHFVDMFMIYMLYGDIGQGYIDRDRSDNLYMYMNEFGYNTIHKFIGSDDFMEMFAQW